LKESTGVNISVYDLIQPWNQTIELLHSEQVLNHKAILRWL